ncbi:MAG: hypothetical protein GY801_07020 [bacterium]|nr:hypothetical protein [bacterium]
MSYDDTIWPVEEMLAYDEFTDRVELLRELENWVKNIQRMTAPGTALIAPRRMGKTVLLDRLVNRVFFQPDNRVAPFYFKMKREKMILHEFLRWYARIFFRQYIAYCHQDPVLFKAEELPLEELIDIPSKHQAVIMAKESIQGFLKHDAIYGHEGARNHWDAFIRVPEILGSHSGVRVAVIIDEFQDMKFYVYDTSPDHFLDMNAKGLLTEQGAINLTATYDRQAQSRKAPMLVSGSAVTMIFRTVMGGPLGGRFGFKYIRPLSIPDGAALLQDVIRYYAPKLTIAPEHAVYASTQVGGHPYYLYCLAVSDSGDKSFQDQLSIDRVIRYEIEQGKIYGFWQTHFQDNHRYINDDNDIGLGKKIIYYFTRYNDKPVDIKAIAQTLKVSKEDVEAKIEKLYLADLAYRSAAKYYTFNDICLMRYIKFVYEQDVEEGLEPIDLSRQNLFNTLKGKFLELVVQVTMMKMNRETLQGEWFGVTGDITAPLFQFADTKTVKGASTRQYQIDVYGKEVGEKGVWLCECKYTKQPMGMAQVTKLEEAATVMTQEAKEMGRDIPEIQFWLVSTGGFTKDINQYIETRSDIYASDYDGINGIFHAYGGNYRIPIFPRD